MAVSFVGAGSAVYSADALSVPWPGTQSAGDVGLLLLETNETDTVSVSAGTELASSPQYHVAQAHRFSVFYLVAAGSDANVSIPDPGNHGIAQILVFSGVDTTAPINATVGASPGVPSTSVTCAGVTTTVDECGIVHIVGTGRDGNANAQFDSWANANLESISEIADVTTGTAGGGGFGAAWGIKTTAGATGDCTVTQAVSAIYTTITVALEPAGGGATNTDTAAGSGSIAITGSTTATLRTHLGIAASGSVTITGSVANGARSYTGSAANGSIIIAGSNADGIYTPVGALTSTADYGSVVITGASAIGRHDYLAAAGSGSITITGSAANAVTSLGSTADSGSIAITGSNALAIRTWLSSAEAGSVTVAGVAANGVASTTTTTGTLDPATIAAIADAVWAHSTAVQIEARLTEAWGRLGLDPANPLISGQTEISFGAIVMALTGNETSSTLTRQ